MKKLVILAIFLSGLLSTVHAELPSICFDGTFAGGDECNIMVDGKKVEAGLVPDEFYAGEDVLIKELDEITESLHDSIDQH